MPTWVKEIPKISAFTGRAANRAKSPSKDTQTAKPSVLIIHFGEFCLLIKVALTGYPVKDGILVYTKMVNLIEISVKKRALRWVQQKILGEA